jgi:hypothetical protein
MKDDQAAQGQTRGRPKADNVRVSPPWGVVEQARDPGIVRGVRLEHNGNLALLLQSAGEGFRGTVGRH